MARELHYQASMSEIDNNGNGGQSNSGLAALMASMLEQVEGVVAEGVETFKGCVGEHLENVTVLDPNNPESSALIAKGNNFLQGFKLWMEPNSSMAQSDSEDIDRPLDVNDPALDRGFQALAAVLHSDLLSPEDLEYFTNNHGQPLDDTEEKIYSIPQNKIMA